MISCLIFKPVSQIPNEISQNATLLSEYLSYHHVWGNLHNTTVPIGGDSTGPAGAGGAGGPMSSMMSTSMSSWSSAMSESSGSASSPESVGGLPGINTTPEGANAGSYRRSLERITHRQAEGSSAPLSSPSGSPSPPPSRGKPPPPQLLSGIYPNISIGRTLLNSPNFVQLEGNKSQVVAWTRSGEQGNVTVMNQM